MKFAQARQMEFLEILNLNSINTELNARQVFSIMRANKGSKMHDLPERCDEDAPYEINCYTDGSWLFPLKTYMGLGGAGLWWPERGTPNDPKHRNPNEISNNEYNLGFYEQREDSSLDTQK